MHNGFGRSNLELRGPRSGLDIAPRSHRGVDKAPEAPPRSCLNSKPPPKREVQRTANSRVSEVP
eukprot:274253-Alexandrium_andersonii.AAC.1